MRMAQQAKHGGEEGEEERRGWKRRSRGWERKGAGLPVGRVCKPVPAGLHPGQLCAVSCEEGLDFLVVMVTAQEIGIEVVLRRDLHDFWLELVCAHPVGVLPVQLGHLGVPGAAVGEHVTYGVVVAVEEDPPAGPALPPGVDAGQEHPELQQVDGEAAEEVGEGPGPVLAGAQSDQLAVKRDGSSNFSQNALWPSLM